MVEEWCGDTDGRLIPLIIVPLWDAELAAAEVRRNAARGVQRGVASARSRRTSACRRSTTDGYWDPFFAACEETDTVICMHIGSSSKMPSTSADAPAGRRLDAHLHATRRCRSPTACSRGVLVRFPNLKLAYSEGQIGWIPYILERADKVWEENRGWGGVADKVPRAAVELLLPSRSTAASSTTRTACGPRRGRRRQRHVRDRLPAHRLDVAAHQEGRGGDDEGSRRRRQVDKICRGNAIKMLSLDLPA